MRAFERKADIRTARADAESDLRRTGKMRHFRSFIGTRNGMAYNRRMVKLFGGDLMRFSLPLHASFFETSFRSGLETRGCQLALACLVVLFCSGCNDKGQTSRQRELAACANTASQTVSTEARIRACTARIQSGQEGRRNLAYLFNNRGTAYSDEREYQNAIRDFDRSITLDSTDAKVFHNRALAYFSLHRPAQAIEDYGRAIALDAKQAQSFEGRGDVYLETGQHARAVQDYSRAITLNPGGAIAFGNRCFANDMLGKFVEAIKDCDRAIALNPKIDNFFNSRGIAYVLLGQRERAVQDFNKAIALKPDNLQAVMNRAEANRMLGHASLALEDYAKTMTLLPQNADGWNGRCWMRARWNKDLHTALDECNKALQAKPGQPNFLDSRGLVHFRLGDFAAALKDYDLALIANPKEASSLYMRGIVKRRLGTAGANADITAAKALDPKVVQDYADDGVVP